MNLAARLQSLTRELDAAVAIDDTTFRRAGHACADFVHNSDLAIRGRSQPETVHALPLCSPDASAPDWRPQPVHRCTELVAAVHTSTI